MTPSAHAELTWLAATALMTALLFLPYVLARIVRIGLFRAMTNPQPDQDPEQGWSWRAACAHKNAIENLAIFAPLALAVVLAGTSSSLTAMACAVYFFARAVHYVVYALGVPVVRTLAFFAGTACQIVLALSVLGLHSA